MGTMILISTVAILVAIVGCFFIWRLDAARADEVEHTAPPAPPRQALQALRAQSDPAPARSIDA